MSPIQLEGLQTEERNAISESIDQISTLELCQIINNEDATVAQAVQKSLAVIAGAIDALTSRLRRGGRVIYVGAGTSGRLGVLDASEIPPTYSASSEQFVALIAGGDGALRHAQEGAEDDVVAAENDLKHLNMNPDVDSLIGIAASGRTPYVLSCLEFAKRLGCTTIGIACCNPSTMSSEGNADYMISVVSGPEVVTGSTRMKAGTASKLVLNMLSTGVMIKLGKTFGNMMIDLKATNKKLRQRSRNIIRSICGRSCPTSDKDLDLLLKSCDGSVKLAVACILLQISVTDATIKLKEANGVLSHLLVSSKTKQLPPVNTKGKAKTEYVLCVDGGGSKCAAVLLGKDGAVGRGEAGECNVSSVGINVAISSISLAIQRAVDSCPATQGMPLRSIQFKSVWIGLAGFERPNIASSIDMAITNLLGRRMGEDLRISSDIELLVGPAVIQHSVDSVVVLLAGTGSTVMSYERDAAQFKRTGRLGGWGPLLGDDGSGYSIGREALRAALEFADEFNLLDKSAKTANSIDPLIRAIFDRFGLSGQAGSETDLLSRVLSPEVGQEAFTMTRKIAEIAKVVIDTSPSSEMANRILDTGAKSLVRSLHSLIVQREIETSSSMLVLAGGLIQNEIYQQKFQERLSYSGIKFGIIQAVTQPAWLAATYLVQLP